MVFAAFFTLLSAVYAVIYGFECKTWHEAMTECEEYSWSCHENRQLSVHGAYSVTLLNLVLWGSSFITSIILMVGAYKERFDMLIPWMVVRCATITMQLYAITVAAVGKEEPDDLLEGALNETISFKSLTSVQLLILKCAQTAIEFYGLWCAASLYKKIKGENVFILDRCCFCFNLRRGVIVVGLLWAFISGTLEILLGMMLLQLIGRHEDSPDDDQAVYTSTFALLVFHLVLWGFNLLFSILLIVAAKRNRDSLMTPWCFTMVITIMSSLYDVFSRVHKAAEGEHFMSLANSFPAVDIIVRGAVLVLEFYFFWCVASLYRDMKGPGAFKAQKCCCCDLRKGVIGFSVFWVFLSAGFGAYFAIWILEKWKVLNYCTPDSNDSCSEEEKEETEKNKVLFYLHVTNCALCALHIITGVFLACGAGIKNKCLLTPWIFCASVSVIFYIYETLSYIVEVAAVGFELNFSILINSVRLIVIVVLLYFLWNVVSLYYILKKKEGGPVGNATESSTSIIKISRL